MVRFPEVKRTLILSLCSLKMVMSNRDEWACRQESRTHTRPRQMRMLVPRAREADTEGNRTEHDSL